MSVSEEFYTEGKHFRYILDQTVWCMKQQNDVKSCKTIHWLHHVSLHGAT